MFILIFSSNLQKVDKKLKIHSYVHSMDYEPKLRLYFFFLWLLPAIYLVKVASVRIH